MNKREAYNVDKFILLAQIKTLKHIKATINFNIKAKKEQLKAVKLEFKECEQKK